MRVHTPGRYAALALLLGGLACAGNKANDDGTVVAQDSTQANDTSAYKGGQRDTTAMPAPADTTTYAPSAPADTSAAAPTAPADTTSYVPQTPTDTTSSAAPVDTTSAAPAAPTTPTDTSTQPAAPTDSAGASGWSKDTTGGMSHDSASGTAQ